MKKKILFSASLIATAITPVAFLAASCQKELTEKFTSKTSVTIDDIKNKTIDEIKKEDIKISLPKGHELISYDFTKEGEEINVTVKAKNIQTKKEYSITKKISGFKGTTPKPEEPQKPEEPKKPEELKPENEKLNKDDLINFRVEKDGVRLDAEAMLKLSVDEIMDEHIAGDSKSKLYNHRFSITKRDKKTGTITIKVKQYTKDKEIGEFELQISGFKKEN
ncbi:lipoprotein 17-related variable surface protein [Metamycoplasma equirhinis]|uniref:lipoprotein 17-related variable surface protein n=1 Tax=Metamycoplasma equirhinis TaxID=92402 RepID=UPI003592EF59